MSLDKTKNVVNKPKRNPIQRKKPLEFTHRAGYHRRLVNEVPGAVEAFIEAGWRFADAESSDASDVRLQDGKGLQENVIRRVVNRDPKATVKTAVLMEIPEDEFEEIQAIKHAEIDEKEASWKHMILSNE